MGLSENCEARGFAAFRCVWRMGGAPRTRGRSGFDAVAVLFPSGFALKAKKELLTASRHADSHIGRCGKPGRPISLGCSQDQAGANTRTAGRAKLICWCTTSCARAAGRDQSSFRCRSPHLRRFASRSGTRLKSAVNQVFRGTRCVGVPTESESRGRASTASRKPPLRRGAAEATR